MFSAPASAAATGMLVLQRTIGNAAVSRLVESSDRARYPDRAESAKLLREPRKPSLAAGPRLVLTPTRMRIGTRQKIRVDYQWHNIADPKLVTAMGTAADTAG